MLFKTEQQSHNCNYNVGRLKKGPVDWTKIEGTGRLFTDHSFPADQTMLSWKEYPRQIGGLYKYLMWFKDFRRPRDLLEIEKKSSQEVSLFGKDFEKTGKIASSQFEQGSLGDNYFLTAVAALAEINGVIPKLFRQDKYTQEGIFALKVYVKGRPEDVTVDDLFPTYNNKVAFAKPTADGAWWLPLLEKAYAKVNVNYEMLSSGKQSEAFRFLTGAPARDFLTNTGTVDEVWFQLSLNLKKRHVITAACFIEYQGIPAGQGVVVKGYYSLKRADGSTLRLLKLRYPWKRSAEQQPFEYTGKYNLKDKLWTPELKQKVNFAKLAKDEFFMPVESFKYAFKSYTICYLKRSWRNTFVEKRNAVNKRVYRFNFTITEDHVVKAAKPMAATTVGPILNADDHKKDAKVSAQSAFSAAAAAISNFAALEQSQQAGEAKNEKQFDIESQLQNEQEVQLSAMTNMRLMSEMADDDEAGAGDDQGNGQEDEDDSVEAANSDGAETTSTSGSDAEDNATGSDAASTANQEAQLKQESNGLAEVQGQQASEKRKRDNRKVRLYLGAELYSPRMYPVGCPSFQKLNIKLFKVEETRHGKKGSKKKVSKKKLVLLESQFGTNKDGFVYFSRDLSKGQYQLQVKKYSAATENFDFTARIYAEKNIKLIDVEEQELKTAKAKQEKKKAAVGSSVTVSSGGPHDFSDGDKHFTKAGDQDTNEKRMVDWDVHSQIDMELHKQNAIKDVALEESKQAEKGTSNGIIENIRGPLTTKLAKAIKLAQDPRADSHFELHKREFYFMKDAIDKKHGFYFLRVGSNSDAYDLSLKIKIFVKGDLVETSEKGEKLYVYKYPEDKFPGDFKLTTFCNIRPLQGKRTCDYLVPTVYHDRTYVYIQNKVPASLR